MSISIVLALKFKKESMKWR